MGWRDIRATVHGIKHYCFVIEEKKKNFRNIAIAKRDEYGFIYIGFASLTPIFY